AICVSVTSAGSKETSADPTCTRSTRAPPTALSAAATRRTHPSQCIPWISRWTEFIYPQPLFYIGGGAMSITASLARQLACYFLWNELIGKNTRKCRKANNQIEGLNPEA